MSDVKSYRPDRSARTVHAYKAGTIYITGFADVKPFFADFMNTIDMKTPEISILVPVLNERLQLPELFADLARQAEITCELLICDGGSTDGSLEWLQQQATAPLSFRLLQTQPGRARQLNLAAEQATGEWLLFLHVDSRFSDPLALRKGLNSLQQTANKKLAGHFALKFRRSDSEPSVGYYYYEWKARLGRPETIHGDQGFLLHHEFFQQLGRFQESLPVMEIPTLPSGSGLLVSGSCFRQNSAPRHVGSRLRDSGNDSCSGR